MKSLETDKKSSANEEVKSKAASGKKKELKSDVKRAKKTVEKKTAKD